MPTKPLDRLLFIQGGKCFFCRQTLTKADASVEHLLATANGGGNQDENCVACCKTVNAMLGSMSLKDKFQVVLNQQGQFTCPKNLIEATAKLPAPAPVPVAKPVSPPAVAKPVKKTPAVIPELQPILSNLKNRGTSRPRSLQTLTNSITDLLPKSAPPQLTQAILQQMIASGNIKLEGDKVEYAL